MTVKGEDARMSLAISLLVLSVNHLERSRAFYEAIGFVFTEEL